jgi:ornithine carbamoyltransferase
VHFLTLRDLSPPQLVQLVERGVALANGQPPDGSCMNGQLVGLLFGGSSTRTRTSFAAAALKLGASIITYGPADLQLSTGETVSDTGRVLSEYLDALVVRTNGPDDEMRSLACQNRMSVINAMSASEHPTQAIADLITVVEATGSLAGRHIVYLGEGNNTAAALALGVSLTNGLKLTLMTPKPYRLARNVLDDAVRRAQTNGAEIVEFYDMALLPANADVIYTSRWQTMGVKHGGADWLEQFRPFKVTSDVMRRVDNGRTVFMHDLPAIRGQDCDDDVLDGSRSVAFRQARHKMTAAIAVLEFVCAGRR